MILASIDIESTGLDKNNDRIIEMGLVLYSTGRERVLEATSFLVNSDGVAVTEEVKGITGLSQDMVDRFGYSQGDAIEAYAEYITQADAVIGHNINWYDLPVIRNTAKRLGVDFAPLEKLAIDTMTDIPNVKGEALTKMCANAKDPKTGRDVGFTYTKHSAEDDAKAVLRLIQWHDFDAIYQRAQTPMVVVYSHQDRSKESNRAGRKAGFRWNGDFKVWWQAVKETDVQALAQRVPFGISIAPAEIKPEMLRDE